MDNIHAAMEEERMNQVRVRGGRNRFFALLAASSS